MTLKEKLDIQIEAQQFVKARFPLAVVKRVNFTWIVVSEPLNFKELHVTIDDFNIGGLQALGRRREALYSCWTSAKKELIKYESGKKDSPFMDGVKI